MLLLIVIVVFGPAAEQAVLLVVGCLEHRGLPEERVAPRPPVPGALLVFPALLINPQLHQLRPHPLHAMAPVVPHEQRYQADGEDGGVYVHDEEGLVVGVVREDVAGQEVGRGPQEDGDEEQGYAEGATCEAS